MDPGQEKALVWLKIAPASGEPHYGTGFLVRAARATLCPDGDTCRSGQHPPSDYFQGNWNLDQGAELRLELGGGTVLTPDYVVNLINGDKRWRFRLSGLSYAVASHCRFRSRLSQRRHIEPGCIPNGKGEPEIRSGKIKELLSPVELPLSANIAYKTDMMVVDIDTSRREWRAVSGSQWQGRRPTFRA